MEFVVILGAGASAGFGVPTLRQLFKDAKARLYLKQNRFLRETLEQVIWMPRGYNLEKSHLGLTIEEILTLLRDSERQNYGLPSVLSTEDIDRFRKALYVLIKKAIYDGKSSAKACLNPLLRFVRAHASKATWASFNWDCLFESSFYYSSADPGMLRTNPSLAVRLSGWKGNQSTKHVFLKLHGGINWWFENGRIRYLPFGSQPDLNECWAAYEAGHAEGEPVILEPSYYKYSGPMYERLRPQWKRFTSALASADYVIVVGYSLPEADSEARSAMMLGFQANPDALRVVIDPSPVVQARYAQLHGERHLVQLPGSLEEWNDDLEDIFGAMVA